MKILWHSAAPWVSTGYGRVTREVASRIHNTEHEVAVQPLGTINKGRTKWHGEIWNGEEWEEPVPIDEPMEVFSSPTAHEAHDFGVRNVKENYEEANADFYFTHFDTWKEQPRKLIPQLEIPYSSYVIVDHFPAPEEVVEQVANAQEVISMSKYAKVVLDQKGIRSTYIPHGVNTEAYRPLEDGDEGQPNKILVEDSAGGEKEIDLEERTVFGVLAANFGDRKNIPNMMVAFKKYIERVDEDAILYLHTEQNAQHGYNLYRIQKQIGIPQENTIWQLAENYHTLQDEDLNRYYNAFDVLINCSMGESWGLAITEAMAAGVPCIVSNFSSMPEQVGLTPDHEKWHEKVPESRKTDNSFVVGNHGLAVNPSVGLFRERVNSQQFICSPEDIFEAMKYYHDNPSVMNAHGELAREYVEDNYTMKDHVIPKFKSFFDRMEDQIA